MTTIEQTAMPVWLDELVPLKMREEGARLLEELESLGAALKRHFDAVDRLSTEAADAASSILEDPRDAVTANNITALVVSNLARVRDIRSALAVLEDRLDSAPSDGEGPAI